MSDPYLGEIRIFAGNFAPRAWAYCNGTLLSVSQNSALFSLLGTVYGGDGRTTFGLPDLRGRLPIHQGRGPGLSPRIMGGRSGNEGVSLNINQIPSHTHALQGTLDTADSSSPANDVLASQTDGDLPYTPKPSDLSLIQSMNSQTVALTGGSQAHSNMMPYQCLSFIISLFGVYPSRP